MAASSKGNTVRDAYDTACAFWGSTTSGGISATRARVIVECALQGGYARRLDTLTPKDGAEILTWLQSEDYAVASQIAYYDTFKRMLGLSVGPQLTTLWPKTPVKPRRSEREPLSLGDASRLIEWLDEHGYPETADLARLLRGTGLRVGREGLNRLSLEWTPNEGQPYGALRVQGKGDHERTIPVVAPEARALLSDVRRMEALRRVPYKTHLWRWNKGVKLCGITSRLPTPHAMRHAYATNALGQSGGNLALVQELLGHSDPGTTVRYLKVDLDDMARAL